MLSISLRASLSTFNVSKCVFVSLVSARPFVNPLSFSTLSVGLSRMSSTSSALDFIAKFGKDDPRLGDLVKLASGTPKFAKRLSF